MTRRTTDSLAHIDIRGWNARGHLDRPGPFVVPFHPGSGFAPSKLQCWREARDCVSILANLRGIRPCLIEVTTTRCNYGSRRYWFLCPRCRGRCAVLYVDWGELTCRLCSRLCYRSQRKVRGWIDPQSKTLLTHKNPDFPDRACP